MRDQAYTCDETTFDALVESVGLSPRSLEGTQYQYWWTDCCTTDHPCGQDEGDCNNDDECDTGLICGGNDEVPATCTPAGHPGCDAVTGSALDDSTACEAAVQDDDSTPCVYDGWGTRRDDNNNCGWTTLDLGTSSSSGLDCCTPFNSVTCDKTTFNTLTANSNDISSPKYSYWFQECCTDDLPCGLHQGDCNSDDECAGDLICGSNANSSNNCADDLGWRANVMEVGTPTPTQNPITNSPNLDCCIAERECSSINFNAAVVQKPKDSSALIAYLSEFRNCCTVNKPCKLGEGDCDNDEQCEGNLVCGLADDNSNNCVDDFSFSADQVFTGNTAMSSPDMDCCIAAPTYEPLPIISGRPVGRRLARFIDAIDSHSYPIVDLIVALIVLLLVLLACGLVDLQYQTEDDNFIDDDLLAAKNDTNGTQKDSSRSPTLSDNVENSSETTESE